MKNSFLVIAMFLFLLNSFTKAQPDTLTILHVNDTHSNLAGYGPKDDNLNCKIGGIARLASAVGMCRMENPNLLLLHAGDAFIGDLFFNVYFGAAEFQLMNALGFDAMAVGNHEFDLTPETLLGALSESFDAGEGFPLLSANCILEDPEVSALKNYVFPNTIKEVNGVKVGIFGMTTPEANLLSLPAPAVLDTNLVQIASFQVAELNAQNCDVVICLSHLGFSLDQLLAEYVPGIDLIVSAHDHYLFEQPVEVNDVYIVQAGAFYSHLGKMRLLIEDDDVSILDYELIALDEDIPAEPNVAAQICELIEGIEAIYGPVYTQQIGEAAEYFEEVADPVNKGISDTPVGKLVADAFRSYFETDIAIEPGGCTAQPLYAGTITAADAFRTVGYGFNTTNGLGYRMVTFDILGSDLLTGLEFGLAGIELNDEFLIQVSGMSYDFELSQPPYSRLKNVLVNNNPINPLSSYSVSANEFVLEVLQSLLGITPTNVVLYEDVTEFSVLYQYIASLGVISPDDNLRITHTPINLAELPSQFRLEQNYPNPFNPTTTIEFSIIKTGYTELSVINILGEKVSTIVSEVLTPNNYRVEFNANGLASGIYFYRIKTNDFSQTKKMILAK